MLEDIIIRIHKEIFIIILQDNYGEIYNTLTWKHHNSDTQRDNWEIYNR